MQCVPKDHSKTLDIWLFLAYFWALYNEKSSFLCPKVWYFSRFSNKPQYVSWQSQYHDLLRCYNLQLFQLSRNIFFQLWPNWLLPILSVQMNPILKQMSKETVNNPLQALIQQFPLINFILKYSSPVLCGPFVNKSPNSSVIAILSSLIPHLTVFSKTK